MLRTEEINCLHSQSGNFVVMSVETLDKICAKNDDYKPITTIPIKTFLAYYIDKLGLYDDISFLDLHYFVKATICIHINKELCLLQFIIPIIIILFTPIYQISYNIG